MRLSIPGAAILVSYVMLKNISAQESNADYHVWKSYANIRYHYAICYPEDLLIPQGESPNNDGQRFIAKDGAQLLVFGQNNALAESLKDALADTESRLAGPSGKVTYKVLKPHWFVVSGKSGQTVFYARTDYNRDQFKSFELTYNQSAAEVYEPLIRRLTTCFADLAQRSQ
jgi:hypothetical protein